MEDFFKNAMNCLEALFVNAIVEFARWWLVVVETFPM
jgi:hypothetical protein